MLFYLHTNRLKININIKSFVSILIKVFRYFSSINHYALDFLNSDGVDYS